MPVGLRCASFTPKSNLQNLHLVRGKTSKGDQSDGKGAPLSSARAISGTEDGSLLFFDLERNWKPCVDRLSGHSKPIVFSAFSHDETYLASADTSGQIIVWRKS